MLCDL